MSTVTLQARLGFASPGTASEESPTGSRTFGGAGMPTDCGPLGRTEKRGDTRTNLMVRVSVVMGAKETTPPTLGTATVRLPAGLEMTTSVGRLAC